MKNESFLIHIRDSCIVAKALNENEEEDDEDEEGNRGLANIGKEELNRQIITH